MKKNAKYRAVTAMLAFSVAVAYAGESSVVSDAPPPGKAKIEYSPYPDKTFPNNVYFGDTHLHTSYSTDAGMVGNKLGPEAAYRVARGETIVSSHGLKVKLSRPLDFLVIADHAENLGLPPAIDEDNAELLKNKWGREVRDLAKKGDSDSGLQAYMMWIHKMNALDDPLKGSTLSTTYWQKETELAEKYNDPGLFTAFIGFEWTSMPDGNNLHRNIIFRGGKKNADQIVPISNYDTSDPEDLWKWMAAYEKKTGGRLLAIPHNGNISNGMMFDDVTYSKGPLSRAYAESRMRWEPIYEVTQIKGDGETHPSLSPRDEFADFYTWDTGSFGPESKTPDMLPKEYAREALKRGLAYKNTLGANPFKFGVIGSTDSHTSIASTEEDNYFGKASITEPSANSEYRYDEIIVGRANPDRTRQIPHWKSMSGGLAAVWARENTREALWDGMKRKEVYATTGTRIRVRLFAGWDFTRKDLSRSDFAEYGYQHGVPMGGDLPAGKKGKSPTFLIKALRDPDGANLDRIQIIKGWVDSKNKPHERIYDVAVSGSRSIGRDGRCKTPVGNTVDVKRASYSNDIGAPYLQAYWKDPDFDPRQNAFYYVRVIEIPTPKWFVYDARVFGVALPKGADPIQQERAYTSAVWYSL